MKAKHCYGIKSAHMVNVCILGDTQLPVKVEKTFSNAKKCHEILIEVYQGTGPVFKEEGFCKMLVGDCTLV